VISRELTPVPIVPPSFAVAPDGSLWFLDIVKHRVAHYSGSGAFLGAVGGLQFDRFHPYAQDVGFGGGRLHVLEAEHRNAAALLRGVLGRLGPRTPLTVGRRGIAAQHFVSPLPRLSVEALGTVRAAEPPTGGVVGDVEVDDRTGAGTAVPGVLLADGQRLGIEPLLIDDGQEVIVRHVGPSADSELPVRVRARGGPATPPVPAVAGWHLLGATEHSIVAHVELVPARSRDQERYGGGQWLFQVFDDGKALVWQPVPRSRLRGADIKRDLAVGFDGRIYLMLATRRGLSVYRRPGGGGRPARRTRGRGGATGRICAPCGPCTGQDGCSRSPIRRRGSGSSWTTATSSGWASAIRPAPTGWSTCRGRRSCRGSSTPTST
jgi:hypothetical protein